MQRLAMVACLVAALPGRADIFVPPPPPGTAPSASTTATAPGAPRSVAERPAEARAPVGNRRVLCGCASSRFLGMKGPTVVGSATHGAWLHGEASVAGYARGDDGALAEASLPYALDVDPRGTGGASRLATIRATGDGAGLLGIRRQQDPTPRDVATVTLSTATTTASATTAPALRALWLEPPETRERRDCGPWRTQRLAFETAQGSVSVEGFVVTDLDTGAQSLVDARHVGAFGIGRVDVCDHGVVVAAQPQRLSIAPVSATGATGLAWEFSHDGTSATPVARLSTPSTADADTIDTPYPVPGIDTQRFSWRSVGGLWILIIVVGVVASLVGFVGWRLKRRRLAEIECVSCHRSVAIDVLDQRTDGFFCPHCGVSGVWKGHDGDVRVTSLRAPG
jgi:predicted RNA-binding Zn-ribbon protein involved in translation (DUF1610 family)